MSPPCACTSEGCLTFSFGKMHFFCEGTTGWVLISVAVQLAIGIMDLKTAALPVIQGKMQLTSCRHSINTWITGYADPCVQAFTPYRLLLKGAAELHSKLALQGGTSSMMVLQVTDAG